MTTQRQAFSRGGGNVSAGQKRHAERTQCPACGRKQALVSFRDEIGFGVECRWRDRGCRYSRWTNRETMVTTEVGLPDPPPNPHPQEDR